jgi:hypothetical protein
MPEDWLQKKIGMEKRTVFIYFIFIYYLVKEKTEARFVFSITAHERAAKKIHKLCTNLNSVLLRRAHHFILCFVVFGSPLTFFCDRVDSSSSESIPYGEGIAAKKSSQHLTRTAYHITKFPHKHKISFYIFTTQFSRLLFLCT